MFDKKHFILIIALVFLVIIFMWQWKLKQNLTENTVSCGGDWSYNEISCPLGSYCKSLNQGPFAGGVCKTLL